MSNSASAHRTITRFWIECAALSPSLGVTPQRSECWARPLVQTIDNFTGAEEPSDRETEAAGFCHGSGHRGDPCEAPIASIEDHFRRLLAPDNLFVVPKVWSGLGEMPEMIAAARHRIAESH